MKTFTTVVLICFLMLAGCAHNRDVDSAIAVVAPASQVTPGSQAASPLLGESMPAANPSENKDAGVEAQEYRVVREPPDAAPAVKNDTSGVADQGAQDTAAEALAADSSAPDDDSDDLDDLDEDLADLEDEFADAAVETDIADPLAPFNRAMFYFNDKLYFWVLKPVARGYSAVVPSPVRTGVKNFFHNLGFPMRFVNCLLQGKEAAAGREFSRFFVNTTVGVLGLWDVGTSQLKFDPAEEDFGQTFGSYGIGHGFYIVWPFLGSSSLRDSVGMVGDRFLRPTTYLSPTEVSLAVGGFRIVNETSFRIGDYEALKKAAIDPYEALRSFYAQFRRVQVEQ